jgi:protoheme ferro-lyase
MGIAVNQTSSGFSPSSSIIPIEEAHVAQHASLWIVLIVGAILFGVALVGILVSRRTLEPVFATAALGAFACAAWAFGELSIVYDRFDVLLWALVFGVAAFGGGYALASTLLSTIAAHPRRLAAPIQLPDDTGTTAVILLGDVDPDVYDERWTAADLDKLSDEGLLHVSIPILPFLFFAQKARYRAVGGVSPAAKQLQALAERVSDAVKGTKVARVEPAWLGGERDLAVRVLRLAEHGFRTIVIDEVMIAGSLELDEAKRRVDALRLSDLGVSVTYTESLWGAERIAALVAERVMAVAADPAETGVVLVGLGQPEERARSCGSFDEHETGFLTRVRLLLLDRGISENNVRLAWADWHGPDVTSAVRHVAALGCTRVVVAPACFPLDTVETMLELPLSVRQARIDEQVSVVSLNAWHDDPALVEELRARTLTHVT